MTSTMLGPFCNKTVNTLSCSESYNLAGTDLGNGSYIGMKSNFIACRNTNGIICHEEGSNIYSLDVMGIAEEIFVAVTNLTLNETKPSNTNLSLMCYARHGAVPLKTVYDFAVDISKEPLVIDFPKSGIWYFTIQPIDNSSTNGTAQSLKTCYLLVWQVSRCPLEKAGLNCTFEKHILQVDFKIFRTFVYYILTNSYDEE